jgi:PIN domain nuclease of toxin-antitoxin system
MRYLLDTHTLIWFIMGDPNLPVHLRTLIETLENQRLVSVASLWEIAVKVSLGKLDIGSSFEQFIPGQLNANRIEILPISVTHLQRIAQLPFHHRDPFDRLIIAQSLVEDIPVLSRDRQFDQYEILRLWNEEKKP